MFLRGMTLHSLQISNSGLILSIWPLDEGEWSCMIPCTNDCTRKYKTLFFNISGLTTFCLDTKVPTALLPLPLAVCSAARCDQHCFMWFWQILNIIFVVKFVPTWGIRSLYIPKHHVDNLDKRNWFRGAMLKKFGPTLSGLDLTCRVDGCFPVINTAAKHGYCTWYFCSHNHDPLV